MSERELPGAHDRQTDFQLLITKAAKVKVDDAQLFQDLQALDNDVAHRYLEHVVIGKRSPNRELNEALLSRLLEQAAEMVHDDGIKYHLEELGKLIYVPLGSQAYPIQMPSTAS